MNDFFWQFYFPSSDMRSETILNCIEILEQTNLIPRLEYFLSDQENDVKKYKIENRKSWLEEEISKKNNFHVYSDSNVSVTSKADLYVSTSFMKFNGQKANTFVFNLRTKNTLATADLLFNALSKINSEMFIYFGEITPDEMKSATITQIVQPHEKNRKPEYDLPIVKIPSFLSGPEIPFFFGWISYWSKETAEAVGFNKETDAKFFNRMQELNNGGFILQLTEKPLTLEISEHLKVLKNAYERFPKVGGRDTPFEYLK